MKISHSLVVILAIFGASTLYAQDKKGYHLVWADEFSGQQLDTTSWSFQTGSNGWGNNELQDYTLNNTKVKNGILSIIARKENGRYTSARIVTLGKRTFTYGLIEIRAKIPQGIGTWPALWMLGENMNKVGWPKCGELDIMEHVGKHPGYIHSSVHNESGHGQTPYTGIIQLQDPFNNYHLYGLDWTKEYIRFFVDDKLIYQYAPRKTETNWPFDKPMYFIFNIAIGGNWGGPVLDDKSLPQQMDVDYIRVYQKDN